jgi:hypothetical protein
VQILSLAHGFQTDVLVLRLTAPFGVAPSSEVWWSTLYAIIEAASTMLEISRDDLDGTLQVTDQTPRMVLYDAVPGGAGHVSRVHAQIMEVLRAAHRRVASCACGRETSCYRCLRGFRNQFRHDVLRRGPVADLLEAVLGDTSGRAAPEWVPINGQALQQLDGRTVRARHDGHLVQGTLWVEADGATILELLLDGPDGLLQGPAEAFELLEVTG